MTETARIGARDFNGRFVWFSVTSSKHWKSRNINDGSLYYHAGNWVLMANSLYIDERPEGEFIEPETALAWFIRNCYEPPDEISELADERRI